MANISFIQSKPIGLHFLPLGGEPISESDILLLTSGPGPILTGDVEFLCASWCTGGETGGDVDAEHAGDDASTEPSSHRCDCGVKVLEEDRVNSSGKEEL